MKNAVPTQIALNAKLISIYYKQKIQLNVLMFAQLEHGLIVQPGNVSNVIRLWIIAWNVILRKVVSNVKVGSIDIRS